MALFINRWSRPCHVFVAERSEAVDLHDEPARYELSGAAHTPALCGMDLDAANSQGQMYHDVPHVLLVTRLARWSDLEAFATSDDLCEDCREALPNEWPPAAEYVETKPDVAVVSERLTNVSGIDPRRAECLWADGYYDLDDLREAEQSDLSDVDQIGNALAARIKADVDEPEPEDEAEDENETEGLGELFG